jgi:hypothetical protein
VSNGKITGEYRCTVSLIEPSRNVHPDRVGIDGLLPVPTVQLRRRWPPLNSSMDGERRCTQIRYGYTPDRVQYRGACPTYDQ